MAIFTAIASFILTGTFIATGLGVSLLAAGIGIAATIGLNYVAKALAGTPTQQPAHASDHFGVQGTLAAGGDVPRCFGLGYHVTGGSLVYANYWGQSGETPNAYFTQVIAVSDLPGEQLLEVWVNGEHCTLMTGSVDPNLGTPLREYEDDNAGGVQHLWVKYYNGTQTAADPFLVGTVGSADRPYPSSRVGTGICYVICTSLVEDKLFTGFPTFRFALSGIPLYDPTKDSTNGGSGSQRWSDQTTWGGDGDQLPAVQIYNVLRGIRYRYGGGWLYGLQGNVGQARLPNANWNAQIGKCRTAITGESGPEPSYRSGGQVNVNTQPANALEALLTACQGRLSEIGGFYKITLGAPDSPVFSWSDADLLSSEEQVYRPFFALADTVTGIQGTYPDPAQGWETATAPPLYRSDLELQAGNRRLMAAPAFDFVPYRAQVQRLQKSGLEEAQRARTHVIVFPPSYWPVEPGDVGTWDSFRNGYVDKLFRVDSITDRANLDVVANVTEIDHADYDWNHVTDFTGVATGPTIFPRPQPQGVVDWFAEGYILYDDSAIGRRAAIRLAWDGSLPGIVGVQYEVRRTADLSSVTRGRTDQVQAGAIIVSQGILQLTAYQVRGQYLPSSPRDMMWSDWLDVTTPSVTGEGISAEVTYQVTTVMDFLADRLTEIEQRFATEHARLASGEWEDIKTVRNETTAQHGTAMAEIATVETVAVDNTTAIADLTTSVTAQFGVTNANVTTNATAIATLNGYAAAQYSVTLDVNGYATGFKLINGGAGISSATFITDKFLIASPGIGGGGPVPIFAVGNVGGSPKVAIRGDMYADGTIGAQKIIAGDITSDSGAIGALSVKSLSIAGQAVTVPVAQNYSGVTCGTSPTTCASFNMSIDTTGLAGQLIGIWAHGTLSVTNLGRNDQVSSQLSMNGSVVNTVSVVIGAGSVIVTTSKIDVTATGGVMSIPIAVAGSVLAGTFTANGTLFAIACKR